MVRRVRRSYHYSRNPRRTPRARSRGRSCPLPTRQSRTGVSPPVLGVALQVAAHGAREPVAALGGGDVRLDEHARPGPPSAFIAWQILVVSPVQEHLRAEVEELLAHAKPMPVLPVIKTRYPSRRQGSRPRGRGRHGGARGGGVRGATLEILTIRFLRRGAEKVEFNASADPGAKSSGAPADPPRPRDAPRDDDDPAVHDDLFVYNDVNTDVFAETFNLNLLTYSRSGPSITAPRRAPRGGRGYVRARRRGRTEPDGPSPR